MRAITRHSDLPLASGPRPISPAGLRIEPVSGSSQLADFIRVPIILYRDHPSFVAPLNYEIRHRLNPRSNPYFDHADVQLWVAYRGSRPVGRISAQVDKLSLDYQRDLVGHMGFLDAVDDPEVFAALTAQRPSERPGVRLAARTVPGRDRPLPPLIACLFDRWISALFGAPSGSLSVVVLIAMALGTFATAVCRTSWIARRLRSHLE